MREAAGFIGTQDFASFARPGMAGDDDPHSAGVRPQPSTAQNCEWDRGLGVSGTWSVMVRHACRSGIGALRSGEGADR